MNSKKPSKQRKKLYQGTIKDVKKNLHVRVDKKIRDITKKKTILVRTGDKVKVMRGKSKKFEGKVKAVSHKTGKVVIEGLNRKKMTGKEVPVIVHPSNLMIIEVEKKDKRFN